MLPPPVGFTPGAKELFKQENHLALYRLPSAEMVKESSLGRLSCVTKRRPPLSHMISLFIKDTTTSESPALGPHQAKPSRSLGQGPSLLSGMLGRGALGSFQRPRMWQGLGWGVVAGTEDGTV